jgi:hypothetical protein
MFFDRQKKHPRSREIKTNAPFCQAAIFLIGERNLRLTIFRHENHKNLRTGLLAGAGEINDQIKVNSRLEAAEESIEGDSRN